jgi:hypothetical protein
MPPALVPLGRNFPLAVMDRQIQLWKRKFWSLEKFKVLMHGQTQV